MKNYFWLISRGIILSIHFINKQKKKNKIQNHFNNCGKLWRFNWSIFWFVGKMKICLIVWLVLPTILEYLVEESVITEWYGILLFVCCQQVLHLLFGSFCLAHFQHLQTMQWLPIEELLFPITSYTNLTFEFPLWLIINYKNLNFFYFLYFNKKIKFNTHNE